MLESPTQRSIWAAVGSIRPAIAAAALCTTVLFRANSGRAWIGAGKPQRLRDGSVIIPGGRPIALGLALASGDPVVGQSDLIGWTSIVITPEMVGCRVAVITAIECKRETGGRTTSQQLNFVDQVRAAGGISGVANTPAVAQALIRGWEPPREQM
ncbi:MAG: hypothetical protein AB9M53_00790 [Leptothrix sp. (in: b-proteobacteria)]